MRTSPRTHRLLRRWIGLACAVAAIAAPVAHAGQEGFVARGHPAAVELTDGSYADAVDRLGTSAGLGPAQLVRARPDGLPAGGGYHGIELVRGKPPVPSPKPGYSQIELVRSQATPIATQIAAGPRFDWAAAGVGAGIALAAALFASGAFLAVRARAGRVAHP